MEKVESKKVNRRKTAVVAVIVAVILILGVSSLVLLSKSTKKSEPSIITTSTLEKILNRGVPNRSTILTDIVFNVPRVFVRRVLDCNGLVGGLLAIRISGRIFRFAVASGKRYGRHYDGQQQGYCSFHCSPSHSLILVCSFRSAAIPPAADHTLQSAVFGRDALTSSQYSVDNA